VQLSNQTPCAFLLLVNMQELIRPEILPAGTLDDPASWAQPLLQLAPGFQAPLPSSFEGLKEYIETALPAESPVMYGMHPNAGVLLSTSLGETLFKTITDVSGGGAGQAHLPGGRCLSSLSACITLCQCSFMTVAATWP